MKIIGVRAFVLSSELKEPFAFSQWRFTRRQTVLVAVSTDEGIVGWGEGYGPAASIASAVRDYFTPLLLGRDPRDTETLWHLLFARWTSLSGT
jgi:D-galactarolactone cycloisomerase